MELIIDWARADGIRRVHSQVLAENGPMLALCRSLGFAITLDPDDTSVRKVSLDLALAATAVPTGGNPAP